MSVNLWSTTAATNATIDPTVNFREGQAPSTVNNSARAMMAAIAKWRDDLSGNLLTTGSSTAYAITSNQSLTPLVDGYSITARIHTTSGASPTLNVDATGAKAIRVYTSTALPTGAINAGSVHRFTYDSGDDCWYIGSFFTTTTLPLTGLLLHDATQLTGPAIDDELAIYDLSATTNKRITLSDFFKALTLLTAETAPATADELMLYDASASTTDKITLANLLTVINALTEDTTPDTEADFVTTYDASATAAKKVKLKNLSGRVIQRTYTSATSFSTTTTIPDDGSVPQISEGGQVLTASITPVSATNRIRVWVSGAFESNKDASTSYCMALFNGGASAIAVTANYQSDNGNQIPMSLVYEEVAGGTGAITYSVRAGIGDAGTVTLALKYGTTLPRAFMVIEEIVP